jgi:hypothetical protein
MKSGKRKPPRSQEKKEDAKKKLGALANLVS